MQGYRNVKPAEGGKVHKVVHVEPHTFSEIEFPDPKARPRVIYGFPGRVCEPRHNPKKFWENWYGKWIETDEPITCGNCLKTHWPDGEKKTPDEIEVIKTKRRVIDTDRKMFCSNCHKIVVEEGVVKDGKVFHDVCLRSMKFDQRCIAFGELHNKFPKVETDLLDDLYMLYVDDGDVSKEKLHETLNAKWAVITRGVEDNGYEGVSLEAFNTKAEVCVWLAEQVRTAVMEGYSFEVEYILRKSEVVKGLDDFNIKVSF